MIELVPHGVGQNLSTLDCHCPGVVIRKCFLLCFCISVKVALMDENGKVGFTCNSRTSLLEHGVGQNLYVSSSRILSLPPEKGERIGHALISFHM